MSATKAILTLSGNKAGEIIIASVFDSSDQARSSSN